MTAFRDNDTQAVDRTDIDRKIEAGEHGAALDLARRYWRANPNAQAGYFLAARLDRLWPCDCIVTHKVAFLRSFTLEPVLPLLRAEATLSGCRLDTWVGEFNAYGQEILDRNSGLYAFKPQTIVLAVQSRDLSPALWSNFAMLAEPDVQSEIERVSGTVCGLLGRLREQSMANILVHGLERPVHPDRGLLDLRKALGQADAFAAINRRFREFCAKQTSLYLLDYDELQARHGRLQWHDEKKWATARLPFSIAALSWMAQAWWRHLHLFALPQAKVLAVDLDNTIWGGTIGEDGFDGIVLGSEYPGVFFRNFQQTILNISRRGVLLAIVSKNNLADALEVIEKHPGMVIRPEHIAAMRIDWSPKTQNLIELAAELNVGVESFVFVDDNPVECDAVRRFLPQVQVIELCGDPAEFPDRLRALPALERLSVVSEDLDRNRYYSDERQRRELQHDTGSLEDFLRSLKIKVQIAPIAAMTLVRCAQLTQKTNQLNTTTRRFSEAELSHALAEPGREGYALSAADRFGDNGVVGVALIRTVGVVCEIEAFLLSCRVIGRSIETAFLSFLAERAQSLGAHRLDGWFLPTAKNAPAKAIYSCAGLTLDEARGHDQLWSIVLKPDAIPCPIWIELQPEGSRFRLRETQQDQSS